LSCWSVATQALGLPQLIAPKELLPSIFVSGEADRVVGRDGGADHSGVAMSAGGENRAGDEVCAAVVGACANGSWAAPSGLPQV